MNILIKFSNKKPINIKEISFITIQLACSFYLVALLVYYSFLN